MQTELMALIGFGAIGIPIADKLNRTYKNAFFLIANKERKTRIKEQDVYINEELFDPNIISERSEISDEIELLIVCVKNYDLKNSVNDFKKIVTKKTIILPLQNGVFAYEFFCKEFPENVVLQGYVQGPNTERHGNKIVYQNAGALHIGSERLEWHVYAKKAYDLLKNADVEIYLEDDIQKMVWKKWMLNVAGNSITALTGADYSLFKIYENLQKLCTDAMYEFLNIAEAEQINLDKKDVKDVIDYFVSYNGSKKTSMLMDVLNERKTENDYLAGQVLEVAKKHDIKVPIISTLYYLIEAKEQVYMEKKGCRAMKDLFREGVYYSESLSRAMKDIDEKMSSAEFAREVNSGKTVGLQELLVYAVDNTEFYKNIATAEDIKITDFPVMNKMLLNEHYDEIMVQAYKDMATHKMHTSGSTGIPFTVVQDMPKRERHIADLKYFGAMAGYLDRDPMCYLRAKPTATLEQQERDNIWQLDICNLSEKNLTDYYHVMVEKKCTALIAYPSTLETAVDFWSKTFTNESAVKTIISTSETLTDEVKAKLRSFFGDEVGIYARYSNTENGILGQETGESGVYKLNWASYYFEILKMDSDEPAEEGELGRIIVTDLYNKAFPMIRYDTGDVAKMHKTGDNVLPEFAELFGRRMDLIYDTNGEVVSPFLLCRTMRLSHGIEQWQFIQETATEYTLKITANTEKKPSCEAELESFKKTLGESAQIRVEYVENIPVMNSLKRKLIVSKL